MKDENEFVQVALLLMRRQIAKVDRLKGPLEVRTRMAVIRIAIDRLYASFFSPPCPVDLTSGRPSEQPANEEAPNP